VLPELMVGLVAGWGRAIDSREGVDHVPAGKEDRQAVRGEVQSSNGPAHHYDGAPETFRTGSSRPSPSSAQARQTALRHCQGGPHHCVAESTIGAGCQPQTNMQHLLNPGGLLLASLTSHEVTQAGQGAVQAGHT